MLFLSRLQRLCPKWWRRMYGTFMVRPVTMSPRRRDAWALTDGRSWLDWRGEVGRSRLEKGILLGLVFLVLGIGLGVA